MKAVPTFTKSGTKATTATKLDKRVFEIILKDHQLLQSAYVAYLANGRQNLAVTKTRGDVQGGGRKPWRQKGTGRARFGSIRNPIWRGGGIAFGPTGIENYKKHLNTTAKRLAIRQALSLAAQDGKIKVIETFDCHDGKVSKTADLLKKIEARGRVLFVVSLKDGLVNRATGNLPDVKVVHAHYLNVFDVLNADSIVMDQKAVLLVTDWLTKTDKAVSVPKVEVAHE
jgi:large subunit ribosomal protein L4